MSRSRGRKQTAGQCWLLTAPMLCYGLSGTEQDILSASQSNVGNWYFFQVGAKCSFVLQEAIGDLWAEG